MKISFPVISGKQWIYPGKDLICPICKKNKIGEPHSHVMLCGNTWEKIGEDFYTSQLQSENIVGVLDLRWHGAHDDGEGEFRDFVDRVIIVDKVADGGFELHFCSTSCLRKFLNRAVDVLEESMREIQRKLEAKARKRNGGRKKRKDSNGET